MRSCLLAQIIANLVSPKTENCALKVWLSVSYHEGQEKQDRNEAHRGVSAWEGPHPEQRTVSRKQDAHKNSAVEPGLADRYREATGGGVDKLKLRRG